MKPTIRYTPTACLPLSPWADVEILDWFSGDDLLTVEYSFGNTPFGQVLIANTPKGVCYLGLATGREEDIMDDFSRRFRHTAPVRRKTPLQKQVLEFLEGRRSEHIKFHLKGTPYQAEIWRKLIRIPYGKVISYTTLGGGTRYSRAAGTANGLNPIFWIVPCHRVVNTDGSFGRYHWGRDIKERLLAWEFAAGENKARNGFHYSEEYANFVMK